MAGEIRIIRKDTGSRKYLVELGFIGNPEKCYSLAEEGDLGFRDLMAARACAVELQEVIGLPINFYQEKETRTITHEPLPQHWLTMEDGDYVDSKGNQFTLKDTTWTNTHGMVTGEPPYEELKPYMNAPAPLRVPAVWATGWYEDRVSGNHFYHENGIWFNRDLGLIPEVNTTSQLRFTGLTQKDVKPA